MFTVTKEGKKRHKGLHSVVGIASKPHMLTFGVYSVINADWKVNGLCNSAFCLKRNCTIS